jgi:hypothetical protein
MFSYAANFSSKHHGAQRRVAEHFGSMLQVPKVSFPDMAERNIAVASQLVPFGPPGNCVSVSVPVRGVVFVVGGVKQSRTSSFVVRSLSKTPP